MYVKLGLGVLCGWGCLLVMGSGLPAIAEVPISKPAIVAQAKGQLTEENILEAINAMLLAQKQENIDELLKHIAPFATSEFTLEGDDSSTTIILDGKEKHRELLTEIFKRVKTRDILTQDIQVRLSDDGNVGIVTILTFKSLTTEEGANYIAFDRDIMRFAWMDNRPMLVSSQSKGWLAETATSK